MFTVVNPFIFTLRPKLITDISSFDHNIKVFANLNEFYQFIKEDYTSLTTIDKIIQFTYKKLNIYALQSLINNV